MKKNNFNTNSNVKCNVSSCKYNNCKEGTCSLNEVEISCDCDNDKCKNCSETICQSFSNKTTNKKI